MSQPRRPRKAPSASLSTATCAECKAEISEGAGRRYAFPVLIGYYTDDCELPHESPAFGTVAFAYCNEQCYAAWRAGAGWQQLQAELPKIVARLQAQTRAALARRRQAQT